MMRPRTERWRKRDVMRDMRPPAAFAVVWLLVLVWLFRAAGETPKECYQLADEQISPEMGELKGLSAAMVQAQREVTRPEWSRGRAGGGYKDRTAQLCTA
jgi:hypothetical protein